MPKLRTPLLKRTGILKPLSLVMQVQVVKGGLRCLVILLKRILA